MRISEMRGGGCKLVAISLVAAMVNLVSVPVFAQQAPVRKIATFVIPKGPEDAVWATVIASKVRTFVAGLSGVEGVVLSPVRGAGDVAEAQRLVDEGFASLNAKSGQAAEASFGKAYDVLERSISAMPRRLIARCFKGLGVSRVQTGKTQAGVHFVKASLIAWPGQEQAEYAYSLEARNAYDKALREMGEMASGSLDISTVPAGAEVFFDGELRGYSPMTLTNLPPGLHVLSVAADGYERSGAVVDIRPGEAARRDVSLVAAAELQGLAPAMSGLDKKLQAKKAEEALVRLRDATGGNEVLVLRVGLKENAFVLLGYYQVAAGVTTPIGTTVVRDASFLDNVKAFVGSVIGAQEAHAAAEEPLDGPPAGEATVSGESFVIDPNAPIFQTPKKERESIMTKWWFWTIVGGVAAAGGVGLYLALATEEEAGQKGPTGDLQINLHGLPR